MYITYCIVVRIIHHVDRKDIILIDIDIDLPFILFICSLYYLFALYIIYLQSILFICTLYYLFALYITFFISTKPDSFFIFCAI